jgi:U3 small nucleolar RNA-associated protein 7
VNVLDFKRRRINAPLGDDVAASEKERVRKYDRSEKVVGLKDVRDKKVKVALSRAFVHAKESAQEAARTELLLADSAGLLEAEHELERTAHVSQLELAAALPAQAAAKIFALHLPDHAPYRVDVTRDGRYLALGGERGHLAVMDRLTSRLYCELFVTEQVRDVRFLHNVTMFAAAQKRYTYIYDSHGTELHCLRKLTDVSRLDFLPYHFLLVSVNDAGWLKYLDVSTGELVAEHRTKLGPCAAMRQNPRNAVMHLGHTNGTITLWTPNLSEPVVSIFNGPGAVQTLAVDATGNYMAASGVDGRVRVYDVRTYKNLYSYNVPSIVTSLDISQRGVLAIGWGTKVHMYAGPQSARQPHLYMQHHVPGSAVSHVRFAAYDDVLCIGHESGVAGIVVPGAGEPNFDSYVASPYETKTQMREREVRSLLEKVQPNLISLDDVLGRLASSKPRRGAAAATAKPADAEGAAAADAAAGADEAADDDDESSSEVDPDKLQFEAVKLKKKTARGKKNNETRIQAKKSVIRRERIEQALKEKRAHEVLDGRGAGVEASTAAAAPPPPPQSSGPVSALDRFKRKERPPAE